MALNYLINENASTTCTHYFDDFTIIIPKVISEAADQLTGEFLKELGWDVKREKDKPMSGTFAALGVEIDLKEAIRQTDPRIIVRRKKNEDRRDLPRHREAPIQQTYDTSRGHRVTWQTRLL